jgi:hypothetical protein
MAYNMVNGPMTCPDCQVKIPEGWKRVCPKCGRVASDPGALMDNEHGHGLKGPAGTSGMSQHDSEIAAKDLDRRGIGAKSMDYTSINWPHVMDCIHWLRRLERRRAKKDGAK